MLDESRIKIEHLKVFNFEGAIRGMRNPLASWHMSDSKMRNNDIGPDEFVIGYKDLELAQKLIKAGSDHRKFLRQIFISFDATMPDYWWKHYHTYKVSTTENSTSQMHMLGKRLLTKKDFLFDAEGDLNLNLINFLINEWQISKDKDIWRRIIQLMPQSYLYMKTCNMTYETLLNMYNARRNHKLDEWKWFIKTIIKECPYTKELICFKD